MSASDLGRGAPGSDPVKAVVAELPCGACLYRYGVYGISLRSEIPLALPAQETASPLEFELRIVPASFFPDVARQVKFVSGPPAWYQYGFLPDGAVYYRWLDNFEFLLSADGHRITGGWSDGTTIEAFQVYALIWIVASALIRNGYEPLHATCMEADGKAVAFLGESGFGKSSLAACFLHAGHRLLTDDLLLATKTRGGYVANPGPPRLKLFPRVAKTFLPANPWGTPMNSLTKKLIMPLLDHQVCWTYAPLKAIYLLESPRKVSRAKEITLERLPVRDSLTTLLGSTVRREMVDPQRTQRQFLTCTDLLAQVPVARISYPRVLESLPKVRDMILADLPS